MNPKILGGSLLVLLAVAGTFLMKERAGSTQAGVPKFEVDPSWPKDLPNQWMLGQVSGIFVDSHDHVWVTNRPRSLENHDKYAAFDPPQADCCKPAPAILEFDAAGTFVQGWGGPGTGYEWPDNEHGIFVDYKENVWVGGNGMKDTNILKFTKDGKFLLQIGHHGKTGGSNDTENLNRPAGIVVYQKTNEVFVADGYGNRRVIVYDADTGAYKRHWGAYGNKPDDAAPFTRTYEGPKGPAQFNTVHGLAISNDGIVYVGDRVNNRIQSFRLDGTFLKEVFIERQTTARFGTGFGVAFSGDKQQRFFYVPDGTNKKVQIVDREKMEVVGFFGGYGGHGFGEFSHIHSIATDSKGNVYLGEVDTGRRTYRWNYRGMAAR